MKNIITIAIILLSLIPSHAQVICSDNDKQKIKQLLAEGAKVKDKENLMLFFGRKLCGTPYVGHTLEKNKKEHLVVNISEVDCTTFTEQVLALSLCVSKGTTTFDDFCKTLQQIRYRDGVIDYPTRLHYFTWWIADNEKKGIVKDIQGPVPPFSARQTININYMTQHTSAYVMLDGNSKWIADIRKQENLWKGKVVRFIPKAQIKNTKLLRSTIKDGDIIAIITTKKGLDTSHIGIAAWRKDGLHLLNASSIHKKVVDEDKTLYKYMQEHKLFSGIRICRPAL